MDAGSVRVMLVEDEPEIRALVAALLDGQPIRVQAADLDNWLEEVQQAAPDVLLLDLALPGERSAIEHIPRLVAACPTTMVAALTGSPAEELEAATCRAGAFVFYEKREVHQLPTFILQDLQLFYRALNGEDVVAPSAATRRQPESPSPPARPNS